MKSRLLTILCLVYWGLVLYGSLVPYDMVFDWNIADPAFDRAWQFWPFGQGQHTSIPDVVSNIILYMPLGALLATRWTLRPGRRWWIGPAAVVGATIVCGLTSAAIELIQAFSLTRMCSAQDVMFDVIGGFLGATAAAVLGRRVWNAAVRWISLRWHDRPLSLAVAAIALLLAVDAWLPFIPTLDVSQVWHNLKASHFSPAAGFAEHPWHHWIVERLVPYAALAVALGASTLMASRRKWFWAAVLATGFALAVELGKFFIVSRSFNIANVAGAALGAAAGGLVALLLAGRLTARAKAALAALTIILYVSYLELTPFNFAWDPAYISAKTPRGGNWLPLASYAHRGGMEDVQHFLQWFLLLGGFVFALGCAVPAIERGSRWRRVLTALAIAGLIGLVLEGSQFFLPSYYDCVHGGLVDGRTPATDDVFCMALGGALGAWVRIVALAKRRDPASPSGPSDTL